MASNIDLESKEVIIDIHTNGLAQVFCLWNINTQNKHILGIGGKELQKSEFVLGNLVSGIIKETFDLKQEGFQGSYYDIKDGPTSKHTVLDHLVGSDVVIMYISTFNPKLHGITGRITNYNKKIITVFSEGGTYNLRTKDMNKTFVIMLSDAVQDDMSPYIKLYSSSTEVTSNDKTPYVSAKYISKDLSYELTHHMTVSKDGKSLLWNQNISIDSKTKIFVKNARIFVRNLPFPEDHLKSSKHKKDDSDDEDDDNTSRSRNLRHVRTRSLSYAESAPKSASRYSGQEAEKSTYAEIEVPAISKQPETFPFFVNLNKHKTFPCQYFHKYIPGGDGVSRVIRLSVKDTPDKALQFFPGKVVGYKLKSDNSEDTIGFDKMDINPNLYNFIDLDMGQDNSITVVPKVIEKDIDQQSKTRVVQHNFNVSNSTGEKVDLRIYQQFYSPNPNIELEASKKDRVSMDISKLEKITDTVNNKLRELILSVESEESFSFYVEETIFT